MEVIMVKVDIVSGFLGAGKTTLIRKLLKAYENEKIVLIENEFGEIGIDGEIVKKDGFDVIELEQGCICCSLRANFHSTFDKVIKELKPERIIIEPTGMGLLSQIIEIVNKFSVNEECTINSIITVIDSINYFDQLDVFGYFFQDQIINAGTLILSKSQLIDDEQIKNVIDSLRDLNSKAYIITEDWNNLSYEQIIELVKVKSIVDIEDLFCTEHNHEIMKGMDNVSLETSKVYNKEEIEKVLSALRKPIFGKILRGKGLLRGEKGFLEFNYVNGQYSVNESAIETEGKLCIIGKDLNKGRIKLLFNNEGTRFKGNVRIKVRK
jgi:G3E family GTPase